MMHILESSKKQEKLQYITREMAIHCFLEPQVMLNVQQESVDCRNTTLTSLGLNLGSFFSSTIAKPSLPSSSNIEITFEVADKSIQRLGRVFNAIFLMYIQHKPYHPVYRVDLHVEFEVAV